LRDREIYCDARGDGGSATAECREPASCDRLPVHRSESPTGYSSAGCSPAEPASASPVTDNSSSIPIRRGSQMRCSTSLQGCSPAFCCDRPVAPGTSAANGVSPLLCAPGVISILRRHAAVVKLTPSHAMRSPQGAWTPRPAAADAAASPAPRRLDRQMAKAEIAAGAMRPLRPPQRGERNHTLLARRRECRLRPSRPGRRRTQHRGNWIRIIL
jgi:hypothetical protein